MLDYVKKKKSPGFKVMLIILLSITKKLQCWRNRILTKAPHNNSITNYTKTQGNVLMVNKCWKKRKQLHTHKRHLSCLPCESMPPAGSPWWPARWAARPSAETLSWPRPSPCLVWSGSSCTPSSRLAAPCKPSLQLRQDCWCCERITLSRVIVH